MFALSGVRVEEWICTVHICRLYLFTDFSLLHSDESSNLLSSTLNLLVQSDVCEIPCVLYLEYVMIKWCILLQASIYMLHILYWTTRQLGPNASLEALLTCVLHQSFHLTPSPLRCLSEHSSAF